MKSFVMGLWFTVDENVTKIEKVESAKGVDFTEEFLAKASDKAIKITLQRIKTLNAECAKSAPSILSEVF